MNFLLKIVEGPNKGAEIALVEGVAVTLGKSDACDIILADPTMPDQPLKIEATADGVYVDGSAMEPFAVKMVGATALAIGPADAPWSELRWPKSEKAEEESAGDEAAPKEKTEEAPASAEPDPEKKEPENEEKKERKRGGFLGCLVLIIVLFLIFLLGFGLYFRGKVKESGWRGAIDSVLHRVSPVTAQVVDTIEEQVVQKITLPIIANKYGLELKEEDGRSMLSGNLKTRSERLAAVAEAYQVQPGVEVDISDDESFRNAAEDALFTLTEGLLKVASATNRFLAVTGVSRSPISLKKTLDALTVDLPKMRDVDVSGVLFSADALTPSEAAEAEQGPMSVFKPSASPAKVQQEQALDLPVCGILTKPYPCLVLKNGTRVLEGAPFGGSTVEKIEADSVTLTNSTGRFTWKP
ncbi:MAG: hypothetical protein E7049_05055 [Lentisphaerae bacterium]|nr:hypothetical protein [Lentisphaerota bacterium]